MDEGSATSTYNRLSYQTRRGALRAPAKCKMQSANPTAIRHPERSEVLLRERKRADAKPAQRAGIYEGVFVTFQR